MKWFPRKLTKRWWFWLFALLSPILLLCFYLVLRITIAEMRSPKPQMIFVLGGGSEREAFTAEFAKAYPQLKILVSSGSNEAAKIFRNVGVRNSVGLDC